MRNPSSENIFLFSLLYLLYEKTFFPSQSREGNHSTPSNRSWKITRFSFNEGTDHDKGLSILLCNDSRRLSDEKTFFPSQSREGNHSTPSNRSWKITRFSFNEGTDHGKGLSILLCNDSRRLSDEKTFFPSQSREGNHSTPSNRSWKITRFSFNEGTDHDKGLSILHCRLSLPFFQTVDYLPIICFTRSSSSKFYLSLIPSFKLSILSR